MDFASIEELQKLWTHPCTPEAVESNKEAVKYQILKYIEDRNADDINRGDYDCFVSLKDIVNHLTDNHGSLITSLFIGMKGSPTTPSPETVTWIIVTCVQELVDEQYLLYIYDRQRVRSRIAELVRYLSYLKQRFDEDYTASPGLAHMVKLEVKSRLRPRRDIPLMQAIRTLSAVKNAIQIDENIRPFLQKNSRDSLISFQSMVENRFGKKHKEIDLSSFQLRGFQELFQAAISKDFSSETLSYIIQSSTGSGKTEAFLFPILLYALLTQEKRGTKAILVYPRIDLCNDQLQRLIEYVYAVNTTLRNPIRIGIHHGKTEDLPLKCPHQGCNGSLQAGPNGFVCCDDATHTVSFVVKKTATADIIITTPDSLHRRLMDREGKLNIWNKQMLPKYIVFDEAHIYTNQSGMHVANIVRRLRHKIRHSSGSEPIFIASSATVGKPKGFCCNLFSTEDAKVICPNEVELEEMGREYIVFVKATHPRKILLSPEASQEEQTNYTIATNLSTMIQTAFCFFHTMLKTSEKNRIIGFVDSIDIIKRLGEKLCDAERNRRLYQLRTPDARLETSLNRQCPHVECGSLPPNPYINRCQTYLDGECWWVMQETDGRPMNIQIHKSGTTQDCAGGQPSSEEWDMMITTSALEVGFDHPGIIGTFQYMAPMNIPGFIQRIGRGGRSPADMPIAVVVLGSRPIDNFYFHHTSFLTNPHDSKLEIPLDPENRYIKAMHLTSFIYDYISTRYANEVLDQVYYQVDTEETLSLIEQTEENLLTDICQTFNLRYDVAKQELHMVKQYFASCSEPLRVEDPTSKYYCTVRYLKNKTTVDDIIDRLNRIAYNLEEN